MASVALAGVRKVFPGGVTAVGPADLEVREGEFLVLVGPSGCGKSTLLRLIAGLEEPTEGEIRIGPRVVNDTPPKDRNVAMVFQNYALYPHMTVYQNMAFGLELRTGGGWLSRAALAVLRPGRARELAAQRRQVRPRVEATAQALGIGGLLERYPRQLSGGERQRTALGRAIVREPAVFLFDEPLSNLDAQLRGETRRELKQLHRRLGTTMLYVTHDQTEALSLGDRLAVMERGLIHQLGSPLEVYDRPASRTVAAALGSPPMNFVPGVLRADAGTWRFEGSGVRTELPGALPAAVAGQEVWLGVRPEDVLLAPAGADAAAEGVIALVEPLGDAALTYVDVSAGGDVLSLVAKTAGRAAGRSGERVGLTWRTEKLHLFERPGGRRIEG